MFYFVCQQPNKRVYVAGRGAANRSDYASKVVRSARVLVTAVRLHELRAFTAELHRTLAQEETFSKLLTDPRLLAPSLPTLRNPSRSSERLRGLV